MKPYKIGLAVSKFYPDLAESLIQGAKLVLDPLAKNGKISSPVFLSAPGSAELPLALHWLFQYQECSAVVGLGVVIRGETSHYDSVCRMVERGILNIQLKWARPVICGVLMTESFQQAQERLSSSNHKGEQSVRACLQMLSALDQVQEKL